jgi:threonine/homoserine/homoserine lactone efflux protein
MTETDLVSPRFLTFLLASVILAVTPGPSVLYIVTRTLSQGRRAGLASIGGVALGNLGNAAAACIGLAAVFAASSAAFLAIKLAGAGYLVWLGWKALRNRAPAPAAAKPVAAPAGRHFRDGFFVALLNPKTALFFAALLPQFIDPGAPPLAQSLALGGIFVAIAICTDTTYVFLASAMGGTVRARARWRPYGRYLSAASFIGLGVYAAFADGRTAR